MRIILSLIIATIIILFVQPYVAQGLQGLLSLYHWAYSALHAVFSGATIGEMLRKLLPLILIPLIIAGIPALLYSVIYRKSLPHLQVLICAIWLVLITCVVLKG